MRRDAETAIAEFEGRPPDAGPGKLRIAVWVAQFLMIGLLFSGALGLVIYLLLVNRSVLFP